MEIGYNRIHTVYGSLYGNTLETTFNGKVIKLIVDQTFSETKTGFINFIRKVNGECTVLRFLDREVQDVE